MNKEKIYIGISLGFNSSAAIFKAGSGVLCAVSQERLNRQKNTKQLPLDAIKACIIEAEKKWLTSPLGRIKNAKRRFSELKYDIILDDAPVRNKIKLGASWMADYLKNG